MIVKYVDVHCHIQFDQYAEDATQLIERMREEGVVGIVVGVDYASSVQAVALAEKHAHLFATVGLHPNREGTEDYDNTQYRALAEHPKVVGIGECGLDYFRPLEVTADVKQKQKALLMKQIALAASLDKALIIHARPSKGTQDAYQDMIELLKTAKESYPHLRGDIHFFVGGIAEAEALTGLGFTLSFTAVITFAREYDAVLQTIPLTSILSETDSPYVAPASRRGSRNDPLAVIEVVRQIATIRGEDLESVRTALITNAQNLFTLTLSDFNQENVPK